MCRQSIGRGRNRSLEENRLPRERVDVRACLPWISVGAQVVCSEAIDRDKDNVWHRGVRRAIDQHRSAPQGEDILLRLGSLLHDTPHRERQPNVPPAPARQIHLLRKPSIGLGATDRSRKDLLLRVTEIHEHCEMHRDEQRCLPRPRRGDRKAQYRIVRHEELERHGRRERRHQSASRLTAQREDIQSGRQPRTRLTAIE